VATVKRRAGGRSTLAVRRLLEIVKDYPRDSVLAAVAHAQHYGLVDVKRLERLVLEHIAGDYFVIRPPAAKDEPAKDEPAKDEPEDDSHE